MRRLQNSEGAVSYRNKESEPSVGRRYPNKNIEREVYLPLLCAYTQMSSVLHCTRDCTLPHKRGKYVQPAVEGACYKIIISGNTETVHDGEIK